MAIKDPLMFITIEEFKNWKGFNKLEFDDTTTPDNEIWFAISVASNNIDYLSGHSISKKWPETTLTEFTDEIQTATAYYVRFLLTKDSNYIRGQSSISQGGMTYSETNPTDPYFIVPEVFNCLRKIKEYPNITGFNLDVLPKRNDFFSNFYSNCGENSPLTRYLELINLKSKDPRTKITLERPKHLIGTEIWIDTTGIKSSDSHSLWEVNKENPNFIFPKDFKGISANDKRIIDVGTPTFLTDATNKVYVDNLLDKKQDKIDNLQDKIFNNKDDKDSTTRLVTEVIKTNVGGKTLIYRNNPNITDDLDIPNKKYIDEKLKETEEKFPIAFQTYVIASDVPTLETTNKTIAGAINELKKRNISSNPIKDKWVVIGKKQDARIWTDFTININKIYRAFITWQKSVVPLQNGYQLMVLFKSAESVGTGKRTILTGKIGEIDATLDIVAVNTRSNKWSLEINGGDTGGAIFSLEELQEEKPLKINSNTLNINELSENNFDIELKNNPNPSIPQWKEVGTKININHIKYTFKSNTKYKIYYNFESQTSIKKFAFMSKEFLYGELNTDVQTLYWDKVNDRIIISLQMQNDTIAIVSDPTRYGQLLKLEELQE